MVHDPHSPRPHLSDMDSRARTVFRELVESYLDTGQPVGSRTLSQNSRLNLSAASIRNTLADLAQMGLLDSAHISAGREPTHMGLRLFVDGLLQVGELTQSEQKQIEARIAGTPRKLSDLMSEASATLGGLAGGAGLVLAPEGDAPLKHVEFVSLSPGQALAILVYEDGKAENRLMDLPGGVMPSTLVQAGNYLSARLKGRRLSEALAEIRDDVASRRAELDAAAEALITQGLAEWSGGSNPSLIVRGRGRLLGNVEAEADLERLQILFDDLERKGDLINLMETARDSRGVKLFIGAENPLFSLTGSSLIVAPYMNSDKNVIGALGIIGPTRLNYAKIIPMVDYTAQVMGRLLDRND